MNIKDQVVHDVLTENLISQELQLKLDKVKRKKKTSSLKKQKVKTTQQV